MRISPSLTLFFATDLHGSEKCFRKFLAAAKFYGATQLVLGGDLVGKELIIIRSGTCGSFETYLHGQVVKFSSRTDVVLFESQCADLGRYTAVIDDDTVLTKELQEDLFHQSAKMRLRGWLERAEAAYRREASNPVVIIPGNDDPLWVDDVLAEGVGILNVDRELVSLESGIQIAGLGWSTPTPWNTYREHEDADIGQALRNMLEARNVRMPLIVDIHVPPYNSGLDICPVLDKNLRPIIGPGGPLTAPVGSRAVSDMLLQHKPIIGLFGHIHEARGFTHIGSTLCCNPGSEFGGGKLLGMIVSIKGSRIENWMLTEG